MKQWQRNSSTFERHNGQNSHLRLFGEILVPLILAQSVLGRLFADSRSLSLLAAHVALGSGLVGVCIFTVLVAGRLHSRWVKLVTWFTPLSILTTGTTGGAFLLTGFAQAALIDQNLALVSLFGACLMIAVVSVAGTTTATKTSAS